MCPGCRAPRLPAAPSSELSGKPLTPREQQILELIIQGKTGRQIAKQLFLAEGTVKTYVSLMLKKAGLNSRTALAIWWVKNANSNLVRSAN